MPKTEQILVSSTARYEASGPDGGIITARNLGPDSCYYATAATVSSGSNDGTLASGASLAFDPTKNFISAGTSKLLVITPYPGEQLRSYDKDDGQAGLVVPTSPLVYSQLTFALVASRAYVMRFVPSRPMSITSMSFFVGTAAGADDACDVGIFNAALTTKLVSAGATAGKLNSTGVKNIATAGTALAAGVTYYAAFSVGTFGSTAASVLGTTVPANTNMFDAFGTTAGPRIQAFQAAAHPLAAPVTMGGGTAAAPVMVLREG